MSVVIFRAKMSYTRCVRNFSYSIMSIPLKLYRCLGHGLKMSILFGYNPQIISIDDRVVARCCVFIQAPQF